MPDEQRGWTVLLLHGFASSAGSNKARFFRERFKVCPEVAFLAPDFNPTPRDFEYLTVTGMISRLRQYCLDRRLKDVRLIGSSMGGLVGVHYALRFGGVSRMLLLAPALRYGPRGLAHDAREAWQRDGFSLVPHYGFEREIPLRYDLEVDGQFYAEMVPPACPTHIIHGRHDQVVPIGDSRAYASAHNQVSLLEIEAGHQINDHLELIWETVQSWLLV